MTTAVSLDELAMRTEEKCPIIRGQYSIVPQGEKKAVLHQRVTNFVRALADTYRLELWERRCVAQGLIQSPGLRTLAASTPLDDKDAWDEICVKAKQAIRADDKADGGTGWHTLTERVDRGEPIDSFPMDYQPPLRAYRATLDAAGIEILDIEKYVVLAELRVAGRFDRLVTFGSRPTVADLKTGSLDFGMGEIASQLACYANADTFYDPQTCTHTPMPDVDKDVAIVIHLPAGKDICTLHYVDINAGWEAVQHAAWVRQWRRRRDLSDPWTPGTRFDSLIERRTNLAARIQTLAFYEGALEKVAAGWPAVIPTLKQSQEHTPDQLSVIDDLLNMIEAEYSAPFGATDPNSNASLKGATA